ncbi:MAG: hypothetical protein E7626_05875 [Ruminococcaceae bacterium]|nr:hypothetical protein [Oscillospiraceae bacterium]
MNYTDYISSPDELDTPIMICNSSGLVVYKNASAIKNVRLPRRNTHVQFHLDRGGVSEYENIPSRKKPSVISVDTGDRRANAFVIPYKRATESCSLWVFFSFLQINALSRIFVDYERDLCDVGYEICDIIRCLDEKTFTLDERVHADADARIERRMERILSYMFSAGDIRKNSASTFKNAINLLHEVTERSFDKLGYDVRFSGQCNKNIPHMLDMRGLIVLYLYASVFACKLSRDRRVEMNMSQSGDNLSFRIEFSLGFPQFTIENSKDVFDLVGLAPKFALELLIISRICKNHGYECVCNVTEESHNNVTIDITVPESVPAAVRAPYDVATEEMLLARDIQAAIYYMFVDASEE